jgi:hypothetical protein
MAKGVRKGGGAKVAIKGGKGAATLRKPKGLKPDGNYKAKSIHSSSNKQGILGKVAQKRETRRIMQEGAKKMGISPKPARKLLQAKAPANVMGRKFGKIQKTSTVTMADSARITKMIGRMDQRMKPSTVKRPPKSSGDILKQTRRIIEKASARKQNARFGHVMAKNDRRIKQATAVRQSILNPPKAKPVKRDPGRMTPKKAALRRWGSSMDSWNRAR